MAWWSRSARSRPALSVALTVALFRTIGPKRTRLAAQIVAAIVGAIFVIGLQVAAILSYGTLSLFHLPAIRPAGVARARGRERGVVAGARGAGRPARRSSRCSAPALLLLGAAIAVFSARFGDHAIAAAGVSDGGVMPAPRRSGFRRLSPRGALRRKEWTLLRRDPWLASQTLMQLLYLLPPGADAVARVRQPQRRSRAARAGAGDGGGPARRRPRLARHLRRGRARSRRHRADSGALRSCAPRSRR